MAVTNQEPTDAPPAARSSRWRPWPMLALLVAVVAGVSIALVVTRPDRTPEPGDSSTTTAVSAEDAAVAECRRSILDRADDHPVLGDPDVALTWETTTATHTGVGRYTVEGTVHGELHTATWTFAYTCSMSAEQRGDGAGRWTAVDNSIEQQ